MIWWGLVATMTSEVVGPWFIVHSCGHVDTEKAKGVGAVCVSSICTHCQNGYTLKPANWLRFKWLGAVP